ncbi:MAG: ankyrin repeat domain-containing protein [Acidimicrobiales bacterium]
MEPWFEAVAAGDVERVRALLAEDPSRLTAGDENSVSALRTRATGAMPRSSICSSPRAPLDLYDAAAIGDTEVLRDLLDADPDGLDRPSPDGFTALHVAAYYGEVKASELLLNRGADAEVVSQNELKVRPLNSAAAGGHHVVVHLLLDRGVDVDAAMAGGFTPLHATANNRDAATARLLIERGADPHAITDDGRSVVDVASHDPSFTESLNG